MSTYIPEHTSRIESAPRKRHWYPVIIINHKPKNKITIPSRRKRSQMVSTVSQQGRLVKIHINHDVIYISGWMERFSYVCVCMFVGVCLHVCTCVCVCTNEIVWKKTSVAWEEVTKCWANWVCLSRNRRENTSAHVSILHLEDACTQYQYS